jgi:hypothetical protein
MAEPHTQLIDACLAGSKRLRNDRDRYEAVEALGGSLSLKGTAAEKKDQTAAALEEAALEALGSGLPLEDVLDALNPKR